MEGLILNLIFHTEYPDGVGDTVKIFQLLDLSISKISEMALVARRWGTALDISTPNMYANTTYLLQRQKLAPIM